MIVCFGALTGLIARACDAVELTLVVVGICPLAVVDRDSLFTQPAP